jgi:phosphoserine phosphatase
MNLLLQLIDLGRREVDPAVLQQCYEQVKPGDIASITSMFEALISSLSSGAIVVIIVDGLHFFSQPRERCHGTREVVTRLVEIYRDMSVRNATVKILLASPTKPDFVEDAFGDDEILELPRALPRSIAKSPGRQRRILEDEE